MKSITIMSVKGGWIVSEPNYGSPVEKGVEVFTCIVALRSALPRLLEVTNPVEALEVAIDLDDRLAPPSRSPKLIDGIARRCQIYLDTPAEFAIRKAIEAVESSGCGDLLTDAVILLGKAKDKVSDFVEL